MFNCYIDESNHDRKIRYTSGKGFNYEVQKANNEFIVANSFIKEKCVKKVYEDLLEFRERFSYSEETELKGQNFYQGGKKSRKFPKCFASFTDDNIARLNQFLEILESQEIVTNISIHNKKMLFHKPFMKHMYAANYKSKEIITFDDALVSLDLILDQIDSDNVYTYINDNKMNNAHKELKMKIKDYINIEKEIKPIANFSRNVNHEKAMKNFLKLFKDLSFRNLHNFSDKWVYDNSINGVKSFLFHKKIDEKSVNFFVDSEENMNKIYNSNFTNVKPIKSGIIEEYDSMLLAIPDIIAYNFSLLNDSIASTLKNLDENSKALLDIDFFKLNEQQFNLVLKFKYILLNDEWDDWFNTYTSSDSRTMQYVYAYINCIAKYSCYDDYKFNIDSKPEEANRLILIIRNEMFDSKNKI